jgi:replicative DNA helicase
MNLNQQDIEIAVLAHITRNPKAMDKLQARRISDEHFVFIEEGGKHSYTKALYVLAQNYWRDSGGSLLTQNVLEAKMIESAMKDKSRAKFLTLWAAIEDFEVDDNDLHELLTQLKNRHCMRLMNNLFKEGAATLTEEGLQEALIVLQEHMDAVQEQLNEIGGDIERLEISGALDYFETEYRKRIEQPELYRGIPCGLEEIDSKTFGWLPGQIVVFLAPSSGGKSVMLLNSAMHANKQGKKVLYFSFEMNSWLCLLRHLSLQFKIPYSQLKDVTCSPEQISQIAEGLKAMSANGAYFEYDVNMEDPTPEYIDSRIRDLIATRGKPDLLVVDYIGNMTVRNPQANAKDWENQSKAVEQLFVMAKRYGIPILTAQQINRDTIRDARKQKENNKFMTYDQAAASGGQKLLHLCTYAIAMEPYRDEGVCVFHPVKMRDAWFHPFPAQLRREFNEVASMNEEEKEEWMIQHRMGTAASNTPASSNSGRSSTRSEHRPLPPAAADDDGDSWTPEETTSDASLDLGDWSLT